MSSTCLMRSGRAWHRRVASKRSKSTRRANQPAAVKGCQKSRPRAASGNQLSWQNGEFARTVLDTNATSSKPVSPRANGSARPENPNPLAGFLSFTNTMRGGCIMICASNTTACCGAGLLPGGRVLIRPKNASPSMSKIIPWTMRSSKATIPKGSYGAGSVVVWDQGTWMPEGDAAAGMKKGHLSFELVGKKLKGSWHLVRLKAREKEKRDNWLLIKAEDEFATGRRRHFGKRRQNPVNRASPTKKLAREKSQKPLKQQKPQRPQRSASAKKKSAAMPDFIAPALATLKADTARRSRIGCMK